MNSASPAPWPTNTGAAGRILVIVPTRDRPKQLAELLSSVVATSRKVDVCAYIDSDQETLYSWTESPEVPIFREVGGRIGPVSAANAIARNRGRLYAAVGFVPDDARFTVSGWDDYVLREAIGARVIAPAHASLDVDMPFVSQAWLERLGYLAWPGLYHWGWPSVTAALADAAGSITRAQPTEFWIDHPGRDSKNRDRYPSDIIALYDFFACRFHDELAKLRIRP